MSGAASHAAAPSPSDGLRARAAAAFAETTLVVDGAADVVAAWAGFDAPLDAARVLGAPLFQALGLDEGAHDTGALQLWIACTIGGDADLWRLYAADPPRRLSGGADGPALTLSFGPLFDERGAVSHVVVQVRAAAAGATSTVHPVAHRRAPVAEPQPEQLDRFAAEARTALEDCDAELTRLVADREARHAVHRMFRAVHTVKGTAAGLGLAGIAELAHHLEDVLGGLRAAPHPATDADLTALADLLARLRAAVAVTRPHDDAADVMGALYAVYRPVMTRVEAALTRWQAHPRDRGCADEVADLLALLGDVLAQFELRALGARAGDLLELVHNARTIARPPRSLLAMIERELEELRAWIRLYHGVHQELRAREGSTEALLRALVSWRMPSDGSLATLAALARRESILVLAAAADGAGESDRGRVLGVLQDLAALFAPAPAAGGARAALHAAQRTLRDGLDAITIATGEPDGARAVARIVERLRETVETLTWVPVDDLLRRVTAMATGLAAELGKDARLEVEAAGVLVPPHLHRTIGEILLHAVRNALDHGLESRDRRRLTGKPATGTIAVSVEHEAGGLCVVVADDGGGVDLERVRTRAVSRDLLSPDEARRADSAALHDLLFAPGLSTADQVSTVSGRGVGMDVIRELAVELGGTATITSVLRAGAELMVRFPASAMRVSAARPGS